VLPPDANIPEGAEVEVTPVADVAGNGGCSSPVPTLAERFKDFTGACKGLPEDLAENHDHYLYGTPKKRK